MICIKDPKYALLGYKSNCYLIFKINCSEFKKENTWSYTEWYWIINVLNLIFHSYYNYWFEQGSFSSTVLILYDFIDSGYELLRGGCMVILDRFCDAKFYVSTLVSENFRILALFQKFVSDFKAMLMFIGLSNTRQGQGMIGEQKQLHTVLMKNTLILLLPCMAKVRLESWPCPTSMFLKKLNLMKFVMRLKHLHLLEKCYMC